MSNSAGSAGAPAVGQVIVDYRNGTTFSNPTGTFGNLISSTGTFNNSDMWEPFKSIVNGADTQRMFQYNFNWSQYNNSAITGALVVPSNATNNQGTAIQGYVDNYVNNGTAAVGISGMARAMATNARTFAMNTIASDVSGVTSVNIFGIEDDINLTQSGSTGVDLLCNGILNTGTTSTCLSLAKPYGTAGVWTYGVGFQTGATAAPSGSTAAIYFNPVAAGTNQVSQGMEFVSGDPSAGQNLASLNLSAAGNLTVATSKPNSGFLAPMLFAGAYLCSGAITGDICGARSSSTGVVYLGGDGQGYLYRSGTPNVQLQVSSGNIWTFGNATGTAAATNLAQSWTAAQTLGTGGSLNASALLISPTAPTISSGFGTSPSIPSNNGTAAFTVNVGTGGSASSGVIGLPTATTGWICFAFDITNPTTGGGYYVKQTAGTTTTATLTGYNTSGAATAWTASDILRVSCHAY
jgi:hypothetical protein